MINYLAARIVLPPESAWGRIELRLFVDGQDIVARAFDAGPAEDPDRLLGPHSPLIPAGEPRETRLAEAECTEGCCGALYVRISREDDDEIVWDGWRNPQAYNVDLDRYTFAARQYEAELERAHGDRSWEWPGRTVARLTRDLLLSDGKPLSKWDCSLDFVESPHTDPDEIRLSFTSPPRHSVHQRWTQHRQLLEHDQFLLPVKVTGDDPAAQAARIVEQLASHDPRKHKRAEICGGYHGPLNPG